VDKHPTPSQEWFCGKEKARMVPYLFNVMSSKLKAEHKDSLLASPDHGSDTKGKTEFE
jgi:hypothetical protein